MEEVRAAVITATFDKVQVVLGARGDGIIVFQKWDVVRALGGEEFRSVACIHLNAGDPVLLDENLSIGLDHDVLPLAAVVDCELAGGRVSCKDLTLRIGRCLAPAIVGTIVPDIDAEIVRTLLG